MTYEKLNDNWNAEPNAPQPEIMLLGEKLLLFFYMNYMLYPQYDEEDIGMLCFSQVQKYRLGPENDEGYYKGKYRYTNDELPWGEFYRISDDNIENEAIDDWKINDIRNSGYNHYIFLFRDNTFETIAEDWSLSVVHGKDIYTNENKDIPLINKNEFAFASDGGTIFLTLHQGKIRINCYLDKRINSKTYESFYLFDYPKEKGSINIGQNDYLKDLIMKQL